MHLDSAHELFFAVAVAAYVHVNFGAHAFCRRASRLAMTDSADCL